MNVQRLFLALVLGSAALPASSQKGPKVVPPDEASSNVQRVLTEICWNNNLAAAESQARREGKLVFLVHMKGKIDGMT